MRIWLSILTTCGAILLGGCVSPVVIDHTDINADTLHHYALMTPQSDKDLLSLDGQRIQNALRTALKQVGLSEAPPEQADILVNYRLKPVDRLLTNNWQFGAGYGYRNWGLNTSLPIEAELIREYQLEVSLVSPHDRRVLWQATSRSTLDAESRTDKRTAYINKIVEAMFAHFPPQQTAGKTGEN